MECDLERAIEVEKTQKEKNKNLEFDVDEKKYFQIANYIRGIRGVNEEGNVYQPYFVCNKGVIYFMNGNGHKIIYSKDLKLSENEELNKSLIKGLGKRLTN